MSLVTGLGLKSHSILVGRAAALPTLQQRQAQHGKRSWTVVAINQERCDAATPMTLTGGCGDSRQLVEMLHEHACTAAMQLLCIGADATMSLQTQKRMHSAGVRSPYLLPDVAACCRCLAVCTGVSIILPAPAQGVQRGKDIQALANLARCCCTHCNITCLFPVRITCLLHGATHTPPTSQALAGAGWPGMPAKQLCAC
jgi:hypothetical protein